MFRKFAAILFATAVFVPLASVNSEDWPQWRGPRRDGVWNESNILDAIPADGLKVKWRTPIAGGYSGPAVVGDRVYVTDYVRKSGDPTNGPGTVNTLTGLERILCLDATTGDVVWKRSYDCQYEISYPAGPRTTPTVDGDLVFTLGAEGHLFCLNRHNGEIVWSKLLKQEYQTKTPIWGFSAHPLVDGDTLFCLVGGEGSIAVAFDKQTGEERWRALSASEPGYCPPTMIEAARTRQLLIWDADKLNSLNPHNGELYWSQPLKPDYGMSIMAPQKLGDKLFASGIGNVGALFKLNSDKPGAEVIWTGNAKTAVYCANSTPFLEDDTIYGNDCRSGAMIAVDMADGTRLWETFQPTTGSRRMGHGTAMMIKNQDRFILFSETGDLIIANMTRNGYEEQGRFALLKPTGEAFGRDVVWTHPAFANGHCFARNDEEIVCVSLLADDYE